MFNNAIED